MAFNDEAILRAFHNIRRGQFALLLCCAQSPGLRREDRQERQKNGFIRFYWTRQAFEIKPVQLTVTGEVGSSVHDNGDSNHAVPKKLGATKD